MTVGFGCGEKAGRGWGATGVTVRNGERMVSSSAVPSSAMSSSVVASSVVASSAVFPTAARVPSLRITRANARAVNPDGRYVVYWMTSARRSRSNFALQRALELCGEFGRPLVVLEALRCGYLWASDRMHLFAIEGMRDNAAGFAGHGVTYYPYIEREPGDGKGLLATLARDAVAVVADEYPCFMLPKMTAAAARQVEVAFEVVDGNGVLPMRACEGRLFARAYDFRRFFQKVARGHLQAFPQVEPLVVARKSGVLPAAIEIDVKVRERWPMATEAELSRGAALVASLPIDHGVGQARVEGGERAGLVRLDQFARKRIATYADERNTPGDTTSGLSPYLHFGHVSIHEVVRAVAAVEGFTLLRLREKPDGSRHGFWGMGASAEGFLDEALTWREVGFNFCHLRQDDYDRFESLPEWAQATLDAHAGDAREWVYGLDEFEEARTHDRLWNAAQNELVRTGRMHNYMRMVWAKKILEWSASPREALATLIHLNNKYAVDGRDPNSYTGIMWSLGRYDRPWGPERPIFGVIRYMSLENTARKLDVKPYLAAFGD